MKKYIFGTTKDGKIKGYNPILTFKNEKSGKDYIVYTDNEYDSANKLKIYAAIYNPLTNEFIANVETKEEWIEIARLLDKVFDKN